MDAECGALAADAYPRLGDMALHTVLSVVLPKQISGGFACGAGSSAVY